MNIEKLSSGAYRLSALASGHLQSFVYYGYTKREATQLFRRHIKRLTSRRINHETTFGRNLNF